MGLFNLFNSPDINEGVQRHKLDGGVLLDVRTVEEYEEGHIPNSINIPLDRIYGINSVVQNKNEDIFVYCRSGRRSHTAAYELKRLGYKNVKNIGGILSYTGVIEK